MADTISKSKLDEIMTKLDNNPSHLIGILQDVQEEARFLPPDALQYISEKLGIPLSQIYHVATFFRAFSLEPRGKHTCQVCMGTACHVRGAQNILDELERKLDIKAGQTTDDKEFSLETVNCVGACALAPVVVVDEDYHGDVQASKVDRVIKKYKKKGDK